MCAALPIDPDSEFPTGRKSCGRCVKRRRGFKLASLEKLTSPSMKTLEAKNADSKINTDLSPKLVGHSTPDTVQSLSTSPPSYGKQQDVRFCMSPEARADKCQPRLIRLSAVHWLEWDGRLDGFDAWPPQNIRTIHPRDILKPYIIQFRARGCLHWSQNPISTVTNQTLMRYPKASTFYVHF